MQQRAFPPLLAFLFSKLGKKTGISYIDSTALPVCPNRRIGQHKTFTERAARGKTSLGWFLGFKLPLVFHDLHEIVALKLTPGPVSDTAPGPARTQDLLGKLFGDKGYLGKKLAGELLHRGLTLFTHVRKNMKSLPILMIDKMLLNGRNMAETMIGSSKGFSSLHLPKHRLPSNASLPIMAAVVAYQLDPIKPNHAFFSHRPPAITAR